MAVVAPAGPPPPERLAAGIDVLRSWGLDVVPGAHVLDRHPTLDYLAGTDADRAADLQAAWCDPAIDAVICARGGYGCLRTVRQLDWTAMSAAPPKLFAGSSDVTALHSTLGQRCGVVTLFSPMPATDVFGGDDHTAVEHFRRSLFEPDRQLVLAGPDAGTLVGGRASGLTAGGNLSLLVSAIGVLPPPPAGCVLLLEDVFEAPYRLDHFLTHLLDAGWLNRAAGIALGSWHDCGDDPAAVRAVLADRLGWLGVPVGWELGFGHTPGQLTVPLGVPAQLDADAGTLTLTEPALR